MPSIRLERRPKDSRRWRFAPRGAPAGLLVRGAPAPAGGTPMPHRGSAAARQARDFSSLSCGSHIAASWGMATQDKRHSGNRGGHAMPRKKRPTPTLPSTDAQPDDREELVGLARDVAAHAESGPRLTGGGA